MTRPAVRRAGLALVLVVVSAVVAACALLQPDLDAVDAGYAWGGPYSGPGMNPTVGGGGSGGGGGL